MLEARFTSLRKLLGRIAEETEKFVEKAPRRDAAKQKIDFLAKEHKGRIDDYLNEPENAQRLFRSLVRFGSRSLLAAQMLSRLLERLEQQEILYHVLASYEFEVLRRTTAAGPPAAASKALVFKRNEARGARAEQGSARSCPSSHRGTRRKIHRYSREEMQAFVCVLQWISCASARTPRRRAPLQPAWRHQSRHHRASSRAVALEQSSLRMRSAG